MAKQLLVAAAFLAYTTTVGVAAVCVLSGAFVLRRFTMGQVCPSGAMMNGKTVIITGANTGIGKQTALDIARRNARVILACRNEQTGERASQEIRSLTRNEQVVFRHLDLASFSSIREFASKILQEERLTYF